MQKMERLSKQEARKGDERQPEESRREAPLGRVYLCDRCGFEMIERHCKVVCPNCGSRYDCSDLNIYFD
jgi:rubrerythrin